MVLHPNWRDHLTRVDIHGSRCLGLATGGLGGRRVSPNEVNLPLLITTCCHVLFLNPLLKSNLLWLGLDYLQDLQVARIVAFFLAYTILPSLHLVAGGDMA